MNLGWSRERIRVIDEDLGKSGQNAERRSGIQRLLSEVSLDHVGLILSIETSRLARSCKDWYHLLELCGMFGTLLADAEGIWDPVVYSDRLFLGLSGMMSEAELHVMRSRLVAGKLNKARRGEMFGHVPTGYVRQASGEVTFDPDEQVCATIRLIFDKFAALKSAHAVLRFCVDQNIMMGFRQGGDTPSSELVWRPPEHSTIQCILHNPFYAGVYAYGRRHVDPRSRKQDRPYSGVKTDADPQHWKVFIKDALPAYISWEQYRSNQEQLAANHTRLRATGVARIGVSSLS
jgi:DNA invertase Pin-like site-specific DNA recombinase